MIFTEAELKAKGFVQDEKGEWNSEQAASQARLRQVWEARKGVTPPPKVSASNENAYKSKTEEAYAALLQARKLAGEIQRWDYEAERLALGGGAWYKPDFRVILPAGEVEFHEVKGHWREAARLRIKVAASIHPYKFIAIKKAKGGWEYEGFKKWMIKKNQFLM